MILLCLLAVPTASEAREAEVPKDYFVSNLCLLDGIYRKSGVKN